MVTRHAERTQTLKRLIIQWRKVGDVQRPIDIHLEDLVKEVPPRLEFTSQWQSAYYDKSEMAWYFIDTHGTLVYYNIEKKTFLTLPILHKFRDRRQKGK